MCTIKVCRPSNLLSSSLEIFANQLFRPNLNFLYVPIKLMTKLILRPKHFVVLSREELRLEIFLLHLLLKEWSIGKTWKVSQNFFLRSKNLISKFDLFLWTFLGRLYRSTDMKFTLGTTLIIPKWFFEIKQNPNGKKTD